MVNALGANIKFPISSKPCTGGRWKKNLNQTKADIVNSAPMKTNFKHPVTREDVYVLLDSCHMLKLARNLLAQTENGKNNPRILLSSQMVLYRRAVSLSKSSWTPYRKQNNLDSRILSAT